ncbi:MAG: hypothetical protein MJK04_35235, partial [Psychrosphaera sp.]|nr:hypothetical protein [Psychrosphaera sp.]
MKFYFSANGLHVAEFMPVTKIPSKHRLNQNFAAILIAQVVIIKRLEEEHTMQSTQVLQIKALEHLI